MLDKMMNTDYLISDQEGAIPDHGTESGYGLMTQERSVSCQCFPLLIRGRGD
jgi:hypothetical protein